MDAIVGAAPADLIKDSTQQGFMADVIQASMTTPVIVDFWAPWCGPCKQLGPVLEKIVRDAAGAVKLVKIDIDQAPELARQMRIQSIPAVYAFKGGRPVDAFLGAQPESKLKQFVQKLVGHAVVSPIDEAVEQAKEALDAGDTGTAGALFSEVLQHEPENAAALAGIARILLAEGDTAQAAEIVARIPAEGRKDPFVQSAAAAVELAEQGAAGGSEVEALQAAAEADPANLQARFDLGVALSGIGRYEEAASALLDIVRRERDWNDGAARGQLVKLFEIWGPASPLTAKTRRQLSSILFS